MLKALTVSCDLVKVWPLSKIVDGAMLGDSFKEIKFFMPFSVMLMLLYFIPL